MATEALAQNTIGPSTSFALAGPKPASNALNVDSSVVDLLKSKNLPSDITGRTTLAGQYGISNYTGTASQNMALMALINKGGPSVDNSKISGSSSVIQDINAGKAAAGAATGAGLVPTPSPSKTIASNRYNPDGSTDVVYSDGSISHLPPAPTGTVGTPTLNSDGTTTYQMSDGTSVTTTVDPTVVAARNQITTSFSDTMAQNKLIHDQQVATLQEEKANALSAAEVSYAKANPYGEGSDKSGYMENVSRQYDEQISNLTTDFQAQNKTLTDNMNSQLQTIDATAKSNATNAFNLQLKNLDGTPLTDNERSALLGLGLSAGMSPATAMLAVQQSWGKANIAYNKTISDTERAQRSQALSDFNTMVKGLTTPFDTLPDSVKADLAQKAVDAGLSDNLEDAAKLVAAENKGIIDEQAKQDKAQQDMINAQARLAIAQQNATLSQDKFTYQKGVDYVKNLNPEVVTYLKSLIQKGQAGDLTAKAQATDWISSRANNLGADPDMLANAIQDGLGLKPETVTTTTSKPILGGLFHDTTTSTKTTSSSVSGDVMNGKTLSGLSYTVTP